VRYFSKKAFENWYFKYCEAERELIHAKRSFDVKRRDACLFIFSSHVKWYKNSLESRTQKGSGPR
jgi:hypothetical protein